MGELYFPHFFYFLPPPFSFFYFIAYFCSRFLYYSVMTGVSLCLAKNYVTLYIMRSLRHALALGWWADQLRYFAIPFSLRALLLFLVGIYNHLWKTRCCGDCMKHAVRALLRALPELLKWLVRASCGNPYWLSYQKEEKLWKFIDRSKILSFMKPPMGSFRDLKILDYFGLIFAL